MSSPTSRLLQLLSLLQARRDWPGALLADRLRVSHRTIRRDVDRLREMGYRIEATMGPDGGYRLDAGSELPPLLFDDDQVVALTVALQTAAVAGAGIGEAALRALTTVRQVLPSRVRHRLDALEVANVARAGAAPTPTVSSEVLLSVSAAIRDRHALRFGRAVDDPAPPRRVEPHHLVLSDERWYLVAWDLDRDDWRIFRADRLVPRTPTGPRFRPRTVPGGDVRAFVAARFKGSEHADRWPCVGTVLLHLPLTAVQPFVGDGTAEAAADDRTRYTSGAWSWVALAASLNRFDTEVEVVEPPELVEAFAVLADRNAATATRGAPAQR
jgi:predicted DNA-binding transcriptional regulator YafY